MVWMSVAVCPIDVLNVKLFLINVNERVYNQIFNKRL